MSCHGYLWQHPRRLIANSLIKVTELPNQKLITTPPLAPCSMGQTAVLLWRAALRNAIPVSIVLDAAVTAGTRGALLI